jgi:hypothetical protein
MPPLDTTPRGDEMVRRLPERKFPEPKPQGTDEDAEMGHTPLARDTAAGEPGTEPDISRRPALPDHPQRMAADIEGEVPDPSLAGPVLKPD